MDAQMGVSKEGYAGRIEVVAGPTGRRRRSDAEKARIAAESLTPDAVVADMALSANSDASRPGIPISFRPPFRFEAGHHSEMKPAT
jgi:transposase